MSLDLALAGERLCRRLGGSWSGKSGICRCPAHDDRTPSLSVRLGHKALLFKCHAGCGQDAVLASLRRTGVSLPASHPQPAKPASSSQEIKDWMQTLWTRAGPLAGTHAAAYLAGRGLKAPAEAPLRFLPRCYHRPSGRWLPALLAVCQEADGSITALHRTYLDPHAPRLSPWPPARMLTNPPGQGAVQLAPAETTLGLAEGVETGLAAMQLHGIPVWAALSSLRLHLLAIPASVRKLVLFGENDAAGRAGVQKAKSSYVTEGRTILACYPEPPSNDWANALRLA